MNYFASTSLKELKAMYKEEKDGFVKIRLLMVMHRKAGKDYRSIASMLMVSVGKVHYWVDRFVEQGIDGLHRKNDNLDTRRYLTKGQEEELKTVLEAKPMTSKEVRAYIKEQYGKEYHPNSIPRLLRRLGQSLITARPRHYLANKRSGWAFKAHIKKAEFVEV